MSNTYDEFLEIEEAVIEVEQYDYYARGDARVSSAVRRPLRSNEYTHCNNPHCQRGGFPIGHMLKEMVRERRTELEESQHCHGFVGSPKGRVKYGNCHNFITVRARVRYKEKPARGQAGEPPSGQI